MVKTSNKKGKKTKNKRKKSKQSIDNIGKEILGIIIITISILIFTSLYNYSNGYINYLIRDKILKLTGAGSILFPVLILIIGILFLFSKFNNSRIRKIIHLLMLYLCLLTLFEMRVFPLIENMSLAEKIKISIVYASNMYGGGLLGAFFAFILLKLFGLLGSYIILISTILILISLLIKISYTKMLKNCYSLIKNFLLKHLKIREIELI
ncbi:DNA translocase FtsK 4TM domain-containing protein [Caloranaerobacter azorensis]|uniref:DNA translocase FtsK 4TM region domain-containing protein n=1 Tax=Caloranaerobacter azorensis TaxID=116090 RepID=A0A6P1YAR3_9FIRM|nr:DNA translocase FtsK 4TM domain-containing protein [Caloranaerobacter azorensis]QIB26137.1 hypothetical protein G3A45_01720 [Caloranaerobacter azorensis]